MADTGTSGKLIREKLETIKGEAISLGAARAEVLPTSRLVIREAARGNCFVPLCKFYGSSAMCPPHNPLTPEVTARLVREYRWGSFSNWMLR